MFVSSIKRLSVAINMFVCQVISYLEVSRRDYLVAIAINAFICSVTLRRKQTLNPNSKPYVLVQFSNGAADSRIR